MSTENEHRSKEVRSALRTFIVESFYFDDEATLTDEASFIGSGVMDSTGIMELVAFVEERFGVKIQDSEILPENLDSVNAVESFIRRKSQEGIASRGAAQK
jgi:acyl carrier protein